MQKSKIQNLLQNGLLSAAVLISVSLLASGCQGNSTDNGSNQPRQLVTDGKLLQSQPGAMASFILGLGTDQSQRSIYDVWGFDYDQMEASHNYIQWLFPTAEHSAFNHQAPALNETDVNLLRSSTTTRRHMRLSLKRMLSFYGMRIGKLKSSGEIVVRLAPSFPVQSKNWLTKGNHNFLRITRIIKSLRLLGLEEEAQAFFGALDQYIFQNQKYTKTVSSSYSFWKGAADEDLSDVFKNSPNSEDSPDLQDSDSDDLS